VFELWRVPHKTVIMISCVQEIVYAFFTIAIRRVGGEQCRYNCNSYSANRMHFWDSSSAVFVINRMNEYSNICDLIIYAKTYEWYEFHLVWYRCTMRLNNEYTFLAPPPTYSSWLYLEWRCVVFHSVRVFDVDTSGDYVNMIYWYHTILASCLFSILYSIENNYIL